MFKLPEADLHHILTHTPDVWDNLRGSRLFLTGGTGFFGIWLLESFVHANRRHNLGAEATVLTRDPQAFLRRAPHLASETCLHWHEGDVRTFTFPRGDFTHIIHAATPSGAPADQIDPEEMLDIIIGGTRHTLAFARQAHVRRLLFSSSGAVYGRQPAELTHVGEDYSGPLDYLNDHFAYHEGKRVAEQLCASYTKRHGVPSTIARCFAFLGPHLPLDAHFAAGNFLRDGLAGGPVRVGGDGSPYRSYLHAADLMVWLWTLLVRGQPGRPYNVGSEEAVTIAELARKIAGGCSCDVQFARAPVSGRAPDRYVPSTSRAFQELGLRAWIGLDDAITRTLVWLRNPHDACKSLDLTPPPQS
jgi:nucleoside-diphosphate-sugar epimerase